jgi:hypothetical protein
MTMTGRFVKRGICMLAAFGLLLAVMSSPIRLPSSHVASPPPNYLPRNFADVKSGCSGLGLFSARTSLREAEFVQADLQDECDAEIEDELTVASPPASGFFDVLPSLCPQPYSRLAGLTFPLATRPLRC